MHYLPSGVPDAQFALGQYNFNGGRYQEALSWFEKASAGASSCAQAKYQLGVMYYDGLGVQENPVSIIVYFSCEQTQCSLVSSHVLA